MVPSLHFLSINLVQKLAFVIKMYSSTCVCKNDSKRVCIGTNNSPMECRNEALKIFQQHRMMNTYILLPLLLCRLWCADGSFKKIENTFLPM